MPDPAVELPPWGVMDHDLLEEIEAQPQPPDWKAPEDGSLTFSRWIEGVIVTIEAEIWPRYVRGSQNWKTPAIARLFDADFSLFPELWKQLEQPIRSKHPTTVTHKELFDEEDSTTFQLGMNYERYDPMFPHELRDKLRPALGEGIKLKVGSLSSRLKREFQRPRPYQVAMLQNLPHRHLVASTGTTPSLVSGHCLMSLLAGCNAYTKFINQLSPESVDLLGQLMVDCGDRRVFAGVHYPSDNLSSWFTALRLIQRVFAPDLAPRVTQFAWNAINSNSAVFARVRKHVQDHNSDSPYWRIVSTIEREASS